MVNNLHKENQTASWEYIPDTDTLLRYLDRESLVELSKCCKRYRNQLEHRVLEKLHLDTWCINNSKIYAYLTESCKLEKVLEFLKIDLGSKLKFVKIFKLDCEVDCCFAEKFINLLPNVKTLELFGVDEYDCCLGKGLATILKSMDHLEHVKLYSIDDTICNYTNNKRIFPISLKSLDIYREFYFKDDDDKTLIYESIDASYINLYYLTIASNRMLKNLTCGMPNLQEIDIQDIEGLDMSILVEFLIANPQIRKLNTSFENYSEEVLKAILSSKCLEYWYISDGNWEEIEINNLPSN
ncbi:hypothetical protein CONCODRAFT_10879, partial [Conidiobolus coronatus NRRL 28638]